MVFVGLCTLVNVQNKGMPLTTRLTPVYQLIYDNRLLLKSIPVWLMHRSVWMSVIRLFHLTRLHLYKLQASCVAGYNRPTPA